MGMWDDLDDEAYLKTTRKLKNVNIAMNVALWVLGVILIALGSYSLNALKGVSELLDISLPAGLIVLGVFFVILTVVGCYTSYRERLGGLAIYTVLMLVLLICLVGVGAGTFTYRDEVIVKLGDAWEHSSDRTRNVTQNYFNCCGWNKTHSYPGPNCVIYNNETNSWGPDTSKPNCEDKITTFARDNLYIAACAAIVIGVIEFVATLVSFILVIRVCRNPPKLRYGKIPHGAL